MTETVARRWIDARAVLAAGVLAAWTPSAAQDVITPDTLTDEHVQKAIGAIVEDLYARKDPTSFWEPARVPTGESRQTGGYTALTVLALLHAGQTYQDPRLRDAVASLEQAEMDGTYARAVRANVWAMLPPRFHDRLVADTRWLIDGFSEKAGGWTYQQTPTTTRRDNSITQYGALAWWEAAKRGVPVDRRYWRLLEEHFLDMQLADGGWNYKGDGPATGSMTAAGLATLFITQDFLHAQEFVTVDRARAPRYQQAIDRGLEWMRRNFSPTENPGRDEYFFYYLYGVERVGLASGYKYFGTHDWFREAAAELLARLCRWDAASGTMSVNERIGGMPRGARVRVRHLAFGLLFLSRGRVPVAINKLQTPDVAWNNRPRDVANFTRWLSDKTESALNWQIVSIDAEPHEWLDAPLLYLASHERLPWLARPPSDDDEAAGGDRRLSRRRDPLEKLKRYLDLGGLLVAATDGSSPAFGQSIEQAGTLMYPRHEWRTLEPDHWVYTLLWPVRGKRPTLRGLSNGVRELIIISPATDFSAAFQVRATETQSVYMPAAHLYLFASEMNRPRPRLARHFSAPYPPPGGPGSERAPDDGAPVTIVRAEHAGNWNPEPQALPVFAATSAESQQMTIEIVDCALADIDELDPPPTLVVVNGIGPHDFTAPEREAIRAHVRAGRVILFETPGGRGAFTRFAERACTEIFAQPIRPLFRSRIITGAGLPQAARLTRVDYRPYALEVFAARETTPRLRGMLIDGQPRVLFSREDISHALLDQPCWGVVGYTHPAAHRLLGNILRHARALAEGP
ncbi:MAG: hypothetical protein ACYS0G_09400 [Planctomycetota bacterium]|jgi:hypothetical protein